MDISIIRKLAEERDGGMRKLAVDIGMSEANLHRCVNNNKMQAENLEKIAQVCNVDIRIFFDIIPKMSSDKPEEDKNGHLLQLCKELVRNYQKRDEVMAQLISMVKQME